MEYEIIPSSEAAQTYKALGAHLKAEVREAIELHLRHEPTKASRSRIKRLRGFSRPQYRLRAGGMRIYYDVSSSTVEVLAIVEKSKSDEWLEKAGEP
jgi:mRNA-degrading endonuclease RelE of RelBE toxin-antitoxin system